MTEPTITFKFTNTTVDYIHQELITKKLATLQKYFTAGEVLHEVEFKKEAPHSNGPIHVIEVNLSHEGALYRAKTAQESFEKAIDVVRNELDAEIRRTRNKRNNLFMKGARRLKEMVRFPR